MADRLEVNALADISVVTLPEMCGTEKILLHAILHTQKVKNVYIGGEHIS